MRRRGRVARSRGAVAAGTSTGCGVVTEANSEPIHSRATANRPQNASSP